MHILLCKILLCVYSGLQVACPKNGKPKTKLTKQICRTQWCFGMACIRLISLVAMGQTTWNRLYSNGTQCQRAETGKHGYQMLKILQTLLKAAKKKNSMHIIISMTYRNSCWTDSACIKMRQQSVNMVVIVDQCILSCKKDWKWQWQPNCKNSKTLMLEGTSQIVI